MGERPYRITSVFGDPRVSIHAPRVGERPICRYAEAAGGAFQSTLPAWGSDAAASRLSGSAGVSIHAPRVGERHGLLSPPFWESGFNPRSPRGGATFGIIVAIAAFLFQSTLPAWGSDTRSKPRWNAGRGFNPRSPRGGATDALEVSHRSLVVSIHAPRVGERREADGTLRLPDVSIHAPRVGERLRFADIALGHTDVSIHAPRVGERPDIYEAWRVCRKVSIHAPRVGERQRGRLHRVRERYCFNPRSPRGGATTDFISIRRGGGVSIHAPRVGERPPADLPAREAIWFQSTLPAWGSDAHLSAD
mgnify:FL=1